MKKQLFKSITSTILSAVIGLLQLSCAYAEDVTSSVVAQYDANTYTLSISGSLPELSKKFISVILAPQDMLPTSADDLENEKVIIRTSQITPEGNLDLKIILPDSSREARYKYNLTVGNKTRKSMFSIVKHDDLSSYLSDVNSGGIAEAKSFVENDATGLDDGKVKDEEYIASYINGIKPDSGYDTENLMNAYLVGEGLSYVCSGELNVGGFFELYYHYLDKDYHAEYEKLSEEMQTALNEAFKNNSVVKSFDTTYENNFFVAQFITSSNQSILKKVLLDYFISHNISLTDYNSINNDVYKEKVFDELYKKRTTLKKLSQIIKAFDEEVTVQKGLANDKFEETVSSSGGGAGSGGKLKDFNVNIPEVTPSIPFLDVSNHWSKNYVDELYKKGIINGFDDGTFRPDDYVTRAEFAKMISQILGLSTSVSSNFIDVESNRWYQGYVAAVEKIGIVNGTDGRFMPQMHITRQDAAVILARVIAYKGKTFSKETAGFKDEINISDYAKDSVNGMANLGIITGYENAFAPKEKTTRGQTAALLMRVIEYIG